MVTLTEVVEYLGGGLTSGAAWFLVGAVTVRAYDAAHANRSRSRARDRREELRVREVHR